MDLRLTGFGSRSNPSISYTVHAILRPHKWNLLTAIYIQPAVLYRSHVIHLAISSIGSIFPAPLLPALSLLCCITLIVLLGMWHYQRRIMSYLESDQIHRSRHDSILAILRQHIIRLDLSNFYPHLLIVFLAFFNLKAFLPLQTPR